MKKSFFTSSFICFFFPLTFLFCPAFSPDTDERTFAGDEKPIRVLVVIGGNKNYSDSFLNMFSSMDGLCFDTLSQPKANESLLSDSIKNYHALVFYDMTQTISDEQKKEFIELTKKGTGMVFLHHSIVSYQQWNEFKNIIGGKYYEGRFNYAPEKISSYKHNLVLHVKLINPSHPVLKNINNFIIMDEGYSNIEILPGVLPLLSVDHPDCSGIIAWTNSFNASKVVYLMPGHDEHAYSNENFQKLIYNSIKWTAGQLY